MVIYVCYFFKNEVCKPKKSWILKNSMIYSNCKWNKKSLLNYECIDRWIHKKKKQIHIYFVFDTVMFTHLKALYQRIFKIVRYVAVIVCCCPSWSRIEKWLFWSIMSIVHQRQWGWITNLIIINKLLFVSFATGGQTSQPRHRMISISTISISNDVYIFISRSLSC